MFDLLLTFCNAKSILNLRGEAMSNIGRPKGNNNKEYVFSLRMDEQTKKRLEFYCRLLNKSKSEVIRMAIENLREENGYGKDMGCNNNENGINSD